jgi:phenylacetate-coenzyme A ligase PaaK-like adenylate-forming protein
MNWQEKEELFACFLSDLTARHYENCAEYRRILDAFGHDPYSRRGPGEQFMLPVGLFKSKELVSVSRSEIVKTMTSSGTANQAVSKVFLDRENVRSQTRVLTEILSSFIGRKRLPLIILDTPLVKTDRSIFSARGAGVVGFSMFGSDTFFALDENMKFDVGAAIDFVEKHRSSRILLFGYTYIVWSHVIRELRELGRCLGIENGVLFHIGGWKKLRDQAVGSVEYNNAVREVMGDISVHNYYGMAEQLGSVFVECELGNMHCSVYSDVIIRRHKDFSSAPCGERGIVELLSLLPASYPGHVLLTEDEGEILGEDDCPCGRLGKYFKIHGRLKGAEIRGCSDTYEKRRV